MNTCSNALLLPARKKKIGLTALIDVVFILLLFFMLTSSFNQWKAVDLQAPVSTELKATQPPLLVVLKQDMTARFVGQPLIADNILQLSEAQTHPFDKTQPLVLIPESEVTVQTIVSTLEHLQALGWQRTSLGDIWSETGRNRP